MIRLKKALALTLVATMCLTAFTGCGNDSKGDPNTPNSNEQNNNGTDSGEKTPDEKIPDEKQEFTFSSASAVLGLNPMINTTAPDNGAHELILETLVADVADENGKLLLQSLGISVKMEQYIHLK